MGARVAALVGINAAAVPSSRLGVDALGAPPGAQEGEQGGAPPVRTRAWAPAAVVFGREGERGGRELEAPFGVRGELQVVIDSLLSLSN